VGLALRDNYSFMNNVLGHTPDTNELFLFKLDDSSLYVYKHLCQKIKLSNDTTFCGTTILSHVGVRYMKKLHSDGSWSL